MREQKRAEHVAKKQQERTVAAAQLEALPNKWPDWIDHPSHWIHHPSHCTDQEEYLAEILRRALREELFDGQCESKGIRKWVENLVQRLVRTLKNVMAMLSVGPSGLRDGEEFQFAGGEVFRLVDAEERGGLLDARRAHATIFGDRTSPPGVKLSGSEGELRKIAYRVLVFELLGEGGALHDLVTYRCSLCKKAVTHYNYYPSQQSYFREDEEAPEHVEQGGPLHGSDKGAGDVAGHASDQELAGCADDARAGSGGEQPNNTVGESGVASGLGTDKKGGEDAGDGESEEDEEEEEEEEEDEDDMSGFSEARRRWPSPYSLIPDNLFDVPLCDACTSSPSPELEPARDLCLEQSDAGDSNFLLLSWTDNDHMRDLGVRPLSSAERKVYFNPEAALFLCSPTDEAEMREFIPRLEAEKAETDMS